MWRQATAAGVNEERAEELADKAQERADVDRDHLLSVSRAMQYDPGCECWNCRRELRRRLGPLRFDLTDARREGYP